jgi:hypothetical protein
MVPRLPATVTPPVTPTTTVPASLPRLPKSLQAPVATTPTPTPTVPAGIPRLPKSLQPATAAPSAQKTFTVQGPPAPGTTREDLTKATIDYFIGFDGDKVQGPPAPGTTQKDLIEASRNMRIASLGALREGASEGQVQSIIDQDADTGLLGKIINFDIIPDTIPLTRFIPGRGDTNIGLPGPKKFNPISTAILPTLNVLDTGRRTVLSTLKEVGDEVAVWRGTRGRGVGINPATGNPYRSGEGGFDIGDWWDQVTNTKEPIGYGDLMGNIVDPNSLGGKGRWVNRSIGFFGDVILDPITWVSGPGGLVKSGADAAVTSAAKTAARETAELAAREAAQTAANIAADTAATAAQKAAAQAAAGTTARAAAKAAAEETAALAAAKTAQQTAPRRVLGARTREEMAQIAREARDAAIASGDTKIASVLTDDVIGDIATRGYSAIRGPVADALGVRGGLRTINPISVFTKGDVQKVVIPGTEMLTNAIGSTLTAIRIGKGSEITRGLNTPVIRNVVNTINKGFVGTEVGRRIVNGVTPTGEGGLWGSEAVSNMRRALRTGQTVDERTGQVRKLLGAEAEDYVKLLAQDRAYRLMFAEASTNSIRLLMPILGDPNFFRYSNEVSNLLETPAISAILSDGTIDIAEKTARVSAALGAPVDQQLVQYANDLRRVGDEFYEQANFLSQRQQLEAGIPMDAVKDLPKNTNWFPHVLSDKARVAIDRNKIPEQALKEATGFDRTYALAGSNPRTIVPGDIFFGYKIKPEDMAGGIKRLNEIARQYGKLKFDFFETNAEAAFTRYAQGFAKDTAFTNWIYNMALAGKDGGVFAGKGFGNDIIQSTVKTVPAKPPSTIQGFTNAVEDVLSPARLEKLSKRPELVAKVNEVITNLETLRKRFPKDMSKVPDGFELWRDDINYAINQLELQIRDLERTVPLEAGFPTPTDIGFGPVLSSEADALYTSLLNEANGLALDVASVRPDMWINVLPQYVDGFNSLLRVNSQKYPGLLAQPEIQELLTNVRRLEDPGVAKAAAIAFNRTTGMFKAWVTATPGFHSRNMLSNMFFMASAGAKFENIDEASEFFRSFRLYIKNRGLDDAITGETMSGAIESLSGLYAAVPREAEFAARELVSGGTLISGDKLLPGAVRSIDKTLLDYFKSPEFISGYVGIKGKTFDDLLREGVDGPNYNKWLNASQELATTYEAAKASGLGQIGEIFEGAARPGISGRQKLSPTVAGKISRTLGKPLAWSRRAGGFIEDWSRFALTFDGLKQGLTPEQASARTAKYLIDYQDLSSVDRAIKQIVPFWMWSSRSFPLIVESMWINPRAYQTYNNLARNLQSEEGEGFRPSYLQSAVGLRGNLLFNPDFGFQRQEEGLANLTDPNSILGAITPVLRAPIEARINQRFGIGGQVYSPYFSEPAQAQLRYVAEQLVPQLGAAEKYLTVAAAAATVLSLTPKDQSTIIDVLNKGDFAGKAASALQNIEFKVGNETLFKVGKPGYIEETEGQLTNQEALNKLFSFFGVPVTFLQDYQQVQAMKDIIEQLEQLKSREKNK